MKKEEKVIDFPGGEVVKADTDDGYTVVADAILEALAQTEITARQHRLLSAVIRKTFGWGKGFDRLSASQIAQIMGYTGGNSHLNSDIRTLISRQILVTKGAKIGLNRYLDQWVKTKKSDRKRSVAENGHCDRKRSPKVAENGHIMRPKTVTTIIQDRQIDKKTMQKDASVNSKGKIPYQKIVDLYHEILPTLPKVKKLTSKRQAQIRARVISGDIETIEDWRGYFQLVSTSKFLLGKTPPTAYRPKPFMADLEWLTNESNFTKVWEGRYKNGQ